MLRHRARGVCALQNSSSVHALVTSYSAACTDHGAAASAETESMHGYHLCYKGKWLIKPLLHAEQVEFSDNSTWASTLVVKIIINDTVLLLPYVASLIVV